MPNPGRSPIGRGIVGALVMGAVLLTPDAATAQDGDLCVPPTIPAGAGFSADPLRLQREDLLREKTRLEGEISAFESRCAGVDAAGAAVCRQQQPRLLEEIRDYETACADLAFVFGSESTSSHHPLP